MKFQKTTNKFLGRWIYQAQFQHAGIAADLPKWLIGRSAGDYEISGTSFYTNNLDDMVAIRLQYDRHLKAIRKAELPA